MNQDKTFLGTEPIGKLLRQLAVPTVIAQLVNMLYNIVDRIYIGHIPGNGDLALTGVGVCLPLILIVSAFAALVASGGAPRASIYMGKQDHATAEKILGGCFALQLIVSAVLTAVLLLWNRPLLLTFGASENTIDYAAAYMSVYAIGTVFVQLTLGMNAFITAQGFAHGGADLRRGDKYRAGPAVYFRAEYGRSGRGSGNHYFPVPFLCLGAAVPHRP